MDNEALNLFKILNNEKIRYCVIRDFKTLNNIINSKDIDIYVDIGDKKKIDDLFKKNNWTRHSFNNSKYPHIQYYKIGYNKIYMIDVVFGFYYGKENLKLEIEKDINFRERKVDSINVLDEKLALTTMFFHIVFDKGEISEKNYNILKEMKNDYDKKYKEKSIIYDFVSEMLKDGIDTTNSKIRFYKEKVLKEKMLKKNTFKNLFIFFEKKLSDVMVKIHRRLSKKTIAVIGIDGTGKTSIINSLKDIYKENSETVYMGLKDFKIKKVEKLVYNKNNTFINKIIKRPLLFLEMYSRYLKYRFSGKVVIFDRYVDDILINSNTKIFDTLVYKVLFPKPKLKIYTYCSVEQSFDRKDDIVDKNFFISNKAKYDKFYMKNKKVSCVSTEKSSIEDTMKKVTKILNEKIKNAIFL